MQQRYKKYLKYANFWAIKCSRSYFFFFCKQINISKNFHPLIVSGVTVYFVNLLQTCVQNPRIVAETLPNHYRTIPESLSNHYREIIFFHHAPLLTLHSPAWLLFYPHFCCAKSTVFPPHPPASSTQISLHTRVRDCPTTNQPISIAQ